MKERLKNKMPYIAVSIFVLLAFFTIVGPHVMHSSPIDQALDEVYQSPSAKHWFGTDKFGRDVFARVLHGGRVSLMVAFSSVILSVLIGVPYGLFSGYLGGKVDAVASWILNLFMAFPQFLLLLVVAAILGTSSVLWVVLVIGLLSWMDIARVVRNQTLSLKERDFVLAEIVVGISKLRLLRRHILPNLLAPVIVSATLMVGNVILIESALSFIGLGVQPPTPSWGNIINEGRQVLLDGWWISVFPGLAIVLTVLSLNLLGDRLQEVLLTQKLVKIPFH